MVSSTPIHLRPLRIGQTLDQAVRLYRRNFLKFIGIFAVVQAPVLLLTIIVSAQTPTTMLDYLRQASAATTGPDEKFWSSYLVSMLLAILLGGISFLLVRVIGAAALTCAITADLTGQPVDILEAYNTSSKDWLRLLGTVVALGLASLVAVLWMVLVPCVGWITGPSILAFLGLVISPLATPVVLLEKKGSRAAIRRAWDLARRRFWPLIGFTLLLVIFSYFLVTGPTSLIRVILSTLLDPNKDLATQTITNSIIESIVSLFLSLLYNPLQLTAFTLMYFDLRVRNEGLDLMLQARQVSSEISQVPADYTKLIADSPPAEKSPLLTRNNYGSFALISLVILGLYVLLFVAFLFIFALIYSASGLNPAQF
jgi:hypothetical protein